MSLNHSAAGRRPPSQIAPRKASGLVGAPVVKEGLALSEPASGSAVATGHASKPGTIMAANRTAIRREPQPLARATWATSLALTGVLYAAAASAQTQTVPAVPPASDQSREAAERRPQEERRSGPFIETVPNDLLRVSKLIGIGVIGEET